MTTVTANDKDLIVAYKVPGKLYNTANVEGGGSPDPFDEQVVKAGTSFDVPGTIVHVRELGSAPQQGGTPDENRGPVPADNAPSVGGIKTPQGGTPD